MKKIHLIILLVVAGFIASSDPYGLSEGDPQRKAKKKNNTAVDTIVTNPEGLGEPLIIEFTRGEQHNHPLMAIWVEDTSGNYTQTLYVAKAIAKGVFNYGDPSSGHWEEGEIQRPAALPYWAHKRGVKTENGMYMPTPENQIVDAYTGATPKNNFIVDSRLDKKGPSIFNVLMEINQPWDWNEYWTNNKYPDDKEYKTSAQPAVVYQATVSLNSDQEKFKMEVVGHSHYSGKTGELFEDLNTMSTALEIADEIWVLVK